MVKQKVIRLQLKNYMGIESVDIAPTGNAVFICGLNGQGKSSLIKGVSWLLGGTSEEPEEPVKTGAKKAEGMIETQNFMIKKTKPRGKKAKLTVTPKDGRILTDTPLAVLNRLTGHSGKKKFDPMAFFGQSDKEQLATLKDVLDLDFTALEAERDAKYDQRTESNRQVRELTARRDVLIEHRGTPQEQVSVADLVEEQKRMQDVNAINAQKRNRLVVLRENAQEQKAILQAAEAALREIDTEGRALSAEVGTLVDEDVEAVQQQIKDSEQTNRQVRENAERCKLSQQLDEHTAQSEKLTDEIATVDGRKAAAIAAANIPVEGLALADDRVIYNDLPLTQAPQSVCIKIGLALRLAKDPELPVLPIYQGSLLDKPTRAQTIKLLMDEETQAWIELAGDDEVIEGEGVCQFILEGGEVKA